MLCDALPLIEEAADTPVDGVVSIRHDPMDAIEEALHDAEVHEIIPRTASSAGCTSTCPIASPTSACPSPR